jgi:hypothetical protein
MQFSSWLHCLSFQFSLLYIVFITFYNWLTKFQTVSHDRYVLRNGTMKKTFTLCSNVMRFYLLNNNYITETNGMSPCIASVKIIYVFQFCIVVTDRNLQSWSPIFERLCDELCSIWSYVKATWTLNEILFQICFQRGNILHLRHSICLHPHSCFSVNIDSSLSIYLCL